MRLGLDPDTHVARRSYSPLQTATLNDRAAVVRALLRLGARLELKDASGNTALHLVRGTAMQKWRIVILVGFGTARQERVLE